MTREQIEKAAIKSADEELDDFECRGHRDGFIAGAQWRISSVWHDIDKEKPMPGKHVVNEHWFDFVAEDWKDLDRIMKKWPFKRWAYVDDLMPDGKEDEQ